jgi:hypothetical protein
MGTTMGTSPRVPAGYGSERGGGAGWFAGRGSVSAGFLGHPLQLVAVGGPPGLVHRRQVVARLQQPRRPVDDFPNDVGVAGVPLGVHNDMDQDLVQGDLVLTGGPVRDMSDAVEGKGVDGGIRVGPGSNGPRGDDARPGPGPARGRLAA